MSTIPLSPLGKRSSLLALGFRPFFLAAAALALLAMAIWLARLWGLLPGVHRIASLAKRWLLSTHQGAVHIEHLPGYLDEFCFRFNRRRSRSRGLVFYRVLQLAVGHDPVRYQQLVARSKPKTVRPSPPGNRGHPPSLDRPRASRPWRDTPPRSEVGSDG